MDRQAEDEGSGLVPLRGEGDRSRRRPAAKPKPMKVRCARPERESSRRRRQTDQDPAVHLLLGCRPHHAAAAGLQRDQQGSGAVGEVVDGAGPGEVPGGRGHPEGEVIVRDLQFHGAVEEGQDGGVEVSAGEELEAGAVGAVFDDLFTGLSRRFTARVASLGRAPQRHALVMDLSDRSWDRHRAEGLPVANVGRVIPRSGVPGFVVLDAMGEEFAPATEYLLELAASDRSPQTVRTYALSLLRFLRFLWAVGVSWDQATSVEARDFVLWARQAEKFVGNRNVPQRRGSRNLVTGKRHLGVRYSSSTINHTTTVCKEFYAFQLRMGDGPIVNPFELRRGRSHAHHDPQREFAVVRRQPLRQREAHRVPRSIPDGKFNDLFRRLRSNRDRALVAFYVSSGARASELLGIPPTQLNSKTPSSVRRLHRPRPLAGSSP